MLQDERLRQEAPALSRIVSKSAAYSMGVSDEIVLVTLGASAFNITLPSVSEARGLRTYAIHVVAASETPAAATVIDAGDSRVNVSAALAALGDYVLLQSNGDSWFVLDSVITEGT